MVDARHHFHGLDLQRRAVRPVGPCLQGCRPEAPDPHRADRFIGQAYGVVGPVRNGLLQLGAAVAQLEFGNGLLHACRIGPGRARCRADHIGLHAQRTGQVDGARLARGQLGDGDRSQDGHDSQAGNCSNPRAQLEHDRRAAGLAGSRGGGVCRRGMRRHA